MFRNEQYRYKCKKLIDYIVGQLFEFEWEEEFDWHQSNKKCYHVWSIMFPSVIIYNCTLHLWFLHNFCSEIGLFVHFLCFHHFRLWLGFGAIGGLGFEFGFSFCWPWLAATGVSAFEEEEEAVDETEEVGGAEEFVEVFESLILLAEKFCWSTCFLTLLPGGDFLVADVERTFLFSGEGEELADGPFAGRGSGFGGLSLLLFLTLIFLPRASGSGLVAGWEAIFAVPEFALPVVVRTVEEDRDDPRDEYFSSNIWICPPPGLCLTLSKDPTLEVTFHSNFWCTTFTSPPPVITMYNGSIKQFLYDGAEENAITERKKTERDRLGRAVKRCEEGEEQVENCGVMPCCNLHHR